MKTIHVKTLADVEGYSAALKTELGDTLLRVSWFGAERSLEVELADSATITDEQAVHSIRAMFPDGSVTPITLEGRLAALEHRVAELERRPHLPTRSEATAKLEGIMPPTIVVGEPPKGWTPPVNVASHGIPSAKDLNEYIPPKKKSSP